MKVKVFTDNVDLDLTNRINAWIVKENPKIIDKQVGVGGNTDAVWCYVVIWYK